MQTPYYTGYRSPLCGRPVDGHTVTPLANEIDAVGGLLSKTAYAGLWGYARENNMVVTQAQWSERIGAHRFVDVSGTQFRVPDLRNQFRRFSGTDADNANARGLGSYKADTFKAHRHTTWPTTHQVIADLGGWNGNVPSISLTGGPWKTNAILSDGGGGAETAPESVAFHPRIHV